MIITINYIPNGALYHESPLHNGTYPTLDAALEALHKIEVIDPGTHAINATIDDELTMVLTPLN